MEREENVTAHFGKDTGEKGRSKQGKLSKESPTINDLSFMEEG
jgi:hypothetical protein